MKIFVFFSLCLLLRSSTAAHAAVDELRRTPIVAAVATTAPSVVNVSTREEVLERVNPFSPFGHDPFFERFFNDFNERGYRKQQVTTSLGSGAVINAQGYVITNWHVVEKASSMTVTTSDEKTFEATLVGADPQSDLAVLKIESSVPFTPIPLGDSDDLMIGETVIAIGNPFGLSHTVTTGVVSALHRSIKTNDQVYENFIQTDASINPGNSGGPLLDIRGRLIGINTAIYGRAEGIGFAIPINTARRIIDDLLIYGEVRPPWIGVDVQDLSADLIEHLGYTSDYGVIVSEVMPESPAARAGLLATDIIMDIGGQKVKSSSAYKRIISQYTAGDTLRMTLFRSGSRVQAGVRAIEFPPQYVDRLLSDVLGLALTPNSRRLARRYRLYTAAGLVISEVSRRGLAAAKGLQPGDIILKVQNREVTSIDEFKKQIVQNIHRDSIVMLVQRGRYGYYVTCDF